MEEEAQSGSLQALEALIGYAFKDRGMLLTALTARSYRADHPSVEGGDNQRLEFLGDAVFDLLAAQSLYDRYPEEDEGHLSIRRSVLANGRALARMARRIGLGRYLRLGANDAKTGGRDKDKALADAMEALFGAVWCDGGAVAAQAVYERLLEDAHEMSDLWAGNPKGALQELAQRHVWPDSPTYELVETAGPCHAPSYTMKARVAGGHEAQGKGRTKRAAEVAAARALLDILRQAGVT